MRRQLTSKKKAQALSSSIFLIAMAVLALTQNWWPGILLAFGLKLTVRQFLLGRTYDMYITLFLFFGAFITVEFDINWQIFLPILFTMGAIYTTCREFILPDDEMTEDQTEKNENLEHEIEEKTKK